MSEKTTIETLRKPEFLESTKKKLVDFLNYNSYKEAREFEIVLEKVFKEDPDFAVISPVLFNEYKDIIIRMKLVALQILRDEEIVPTLKDHFSIMLLSFPPVTNDIVDKLNTHLAGMPMYEERDVLKGKIRTILFESQEKITTNGIKDAEGVEQSPTISNWIQNYLNAMGDVEDDSLKLTMYIYNARSKMKLSDKEEDALKSLLALYQFLGKSSLTPEGLDESILIDDDGILKILDHGKLEVIGPAAGEG